MILSTPVRLIPAMAMCVVFAGAASAQVSPPSHLYHLRAGSTEQQGCWAPCACPLSLPQPMRGTFVLTPFSTDPLYQNYSIGDVHWRTPAMGQTLTGPGFYRIGGEFALTEQMTVDLSINGAATQHWDSHLNPVGPGPGFPVITVEMTVHDRFCFDTVLTVKATPFMGDWDGDGNLVVGDVFNFLGDWFAGDGDANEDGQTTISDVFVLVNAWFARS